MLFRRLFGNVFSKANREDLNILKADSLLGVDTLILRVRVTQTFLTFSDIVTHNRASHSNNNNPAIHNAPSLSRRGRVEAWMRHSGTGGIPETTQNTNNC